MSIVLTAEEIEEPFGRDLNDLPMDQIAKNIDNNIKEIITKDRNYHEANVLIS